MISIETTSFGMQDTSFRAAGGVDGIERLVDDFYRIMDELPDAAIIRRMHAKDLTVSRDKLARFLCGWLGGPKRYAEKYGPIRIPHAHGHLVIGADERDAWLRCMQQAITEQDYSADFREYLLTQLRVPAERIVQVCSRSPRKGAPQ